MNNWTLILTIAATSMLQACNNSEGKNDNMASKSAEIPVRVVELKQEDAAQAIQTSGFFTTDDETYLSFKTGGVIDKIYVKEGDAVRRGQLLATLKLTEINAQVNQAKLAYEKAVRDFKRVENLDKDSVATVEQYQNARTGMDVAEKQMEAASFNLSYSEIRALTNGYILNKLASEGQVVGPGTPVIRANGGDQRAWKLKVGVSDRQWALVTVGDKAKITTDAYGDKTFDAVVSGKSEGTDGITGAFSIELTLKNAPKGLASGLFGKATIFSSKTLRVWTIPYDALLDGDRQNGYVFTTNDSKVAVKTPVVIGRMDRDVLTIYGGLESSRYLIVSGSAYLKEGSPIRVIQ